MIKRIINMFKKKIEEPDTGITFPTPEKEGMAEKLGGFMSERKTLRARVLSTEEGRRGYCIETFKLDVTEKLCEIAEKTRNEKVSQIDHIANVTDCPPQWVKNLLQYPDRMKVEDIAHLFYKFGYRVQLVLSPRRGGWMPDGEKPTNPPKRR